MIVKPKSFFFVPRAQRTPQDVLAIVKPQGSNGTLLLVMLLPSMEPALAQPSTQSTMRRYREFQQIHVFEITAGGLRRLYEEPFVILAQLIGRRARDANCTGHGQMLVE